MKALGKDIKPSSRRPLLSVNQYTGLSRQHNECDINTLSDATDDTKDWNPSEVKARILAQGEALGFDKLAVTDTDLSAEEPHVRAWLAEGFAGQMTYLQRHVDKRLEPALLEPKTCRIITARMQYLPADTQPLEVLENSDQAYISRYALGRDYHKVLRRRLAKLAQQINTTLAAA